MGLVADITKSVRTFRGGGIHPPEFKELSAEQAIEPLPAPEMVHIPLVQHIGAPCESLVKKNQLVKMGEMIGRADAFVSAPVHASVSGKVKKIDLFPHPLGTRTMAISIENDGEDTWDDSITPDAPFGPLDAEAGKDYLAAIREAGIVGMGGAAFPTHVKLSPPPEKPIDTIIVNGAECEPYLTSDYRTMLERPESVLYGLRAMMAVLGVRQAVIAIEDNKPRAIQSLREAIASEDKALAALGEVGVVVCKTKYPQGGEKQLISAVLNRSVPTGALPMDVGVVVMNIGTCCAAAEAVAHRKPVITRTVTVTGTSVPHPRNLEVRVGTPFSALLEACGCELKPEGKLLMGGPMMGKAQRDAEAPVVKGTSGLVVLDPNEVAHFTERPCLRCGRCVEACPMNLMPSRLASFTENDVLEPLDDLGILDCVECGSCSYICPSQRNIVQWIRLGKMKLREKKK